MAQLHDNIFNARLRRDQKKFKIWKYAGLMLTYKCSAACAFCYYNCGPDKDGLMSTDLAVSAWQSLESLAGARASVHITGGEPFLYPDRLADILHTAKSQGLNPADSVETNASWAVSSSIVKKHVKLLAETGVERLKISWDPFHAEYIDPANVMRLAEIASGILGRDRVLVRWDEYLRQNFDLIGLTDQQKQQVYRSAMGDYPCRLTGRAANVLGHLAAQKDLKEIACQNCRRTWMDAKGVHIDPFGNVFSGLCSGIIAGNVEETSLEAIWKSLDIDCSPLISTLTHQGPAGLLKLAQSVSYEAKPKYAGKCHLCTDMRQFFFDKGEFQPIIGPYQCYTP